MRRQDWHGEEADSDQVLANVQVALVENTENEHERLAKTSS